MYNTIFISDNFNTKETDLMGNVIEQPIRSETFIREAGKKLLDAANKNIDINYMIVDYARTLKAIIKQEMLNEMISRIENINTFYR